MVFTNKLLSVQKVVTVQNIENLTRCVNGSRLIFYHQLKRLCIHVHLSIQVVFHVLNDKGRNDGLCLNLVLMNFFCYCMHFIY